MAEIKFIDAQHRNTIKKLDSYVIPNVGDIVRFTDDPKHTDWEVKSREIEYYFYYDPTIICLVQQKG